MGGQVWTKTDAEARVGAAFEVGFGQGALAGRLTALFDSSLEKAEFRVRTLGVLVWASSLQIFLVGLTLRKRNVRFFTLAVSLAAVGVTQ